MKEIIICITTIIILGCNEKEKMVAVPIHIGGSAYVTKKMTKEEYKNMKTEERLAEIKSFKERKNNEHIEKYGYKAEMEINIDNIEIKPETEIPCYNENYQTSKIEQEKTIIDIINERSNTEEHRKKEKEILKRQAEAINEAKKYKEEQKKKNPYYL